jgi:hypothetical protein
MFCALRNRPDNAIIQPGDPTQEILAELETGGMTQTAALYWACLTVALQPPRRADDPPDRMALDLCDLVPAGGGLPPGLRGAPRWWPDLERLLRGAGGQDSLEAVLMLYSRARQPNTPGRLLDALSIMYSLAHTAHRLLVTRLATRGGPVPGMRELPPLADVLPRVSDRQIRKWLKGPHAADTFLQSGLQIYLWMVSLAGQLARVLGVTVRHDDGGDGPNSGQDATAQLADMIRLKMIGDDFDLEPFPRAEDTLTLGAGLMAMLNPDLVDIDDVTIKLDDDSFDAALSPSPDPKLPERVRYGVMFACLASSIATHGRAGVAPVLDEISAQGPEHVALTLSAGLDWLYLHVRDQEQRVLDAARR